MKGNTDGACANRGVRTTCGGIVRDHMGSWIRGFIISKDLGSVL